MSQQRPGSDRRTPLEPPTRPTGRIAETMRPHAPLSSADQPQSGCGIGGDIHADRVVEMCGGDEAGVSGGELTKGGTTPAWHADKATLTAITILGLAVAGVLAMRGGTFKLPGCLDLEVNGPCEPCPPVAPAPRACAQKVVAEAPART